MGGTEDEAETRRELERVEELIASVSGHRNGQSEDTPDSADAASDLTLAAEDAAVLEQLRARRDRLKERLGEG